VVQLVEPRVFLVGETNIVPDGLAAYFAHLGIPGWQSKDWADGTPSDIEKLIEVCGRLCYKSFAVPLNPNLTQVRDNNSEYLQNVIKVKHGSVLEHGFVNFILADVSRVFTHELVRHRVGTSMSQESLRFVRQTELRMWIPEAIREDPESLSIFMQNAETAEQTLLQLAAQLKVDDMKSFHEKKRWTSRIRRLAPDGIATTIAWGANIRALRHLIQLRTDAGAEEEIRLVFGKIADIVIARYPNVFGDFQKEIVDGLPRYTTEYEKV